MLQHAEFWTLNRWNPSQSGTNGKSTDSVTWSEIKACAFSAGCCSCLCCIWEGSRPPCSVPHLVLDPRESPAPAFASPTANVQVTLRWLRVNNKLSLQLYRGIQQGWQECLKSCALPGCWSSKQSYEKTPYPLGFDVQNPHQKRNTVSLLK